MANLQEVRDRIGSVITTQQITKAMKLVAASKLKRAQDRITDMRPYSNSLFGILQNITSNVDVEELDLDFSKERKEEKVLIVLITSDKGLCGGFNANLNKKVRTMLNTELSTQYERGDVTLMPIGKKGFDFFKRYENLTIDKSYINLFSNLNFEEVSEAAEFAMNGFLTGNFDKIVVVYSQFVNAATQNFTIERFLPIADFESDKENEEATSQNVDFVFEPEKKKLIQELIPKILKTQFYRYLLDNNASEHGARMVAMDQATENANDLLNDLKLQYNRERQAAITKEILEIVGGAAALEEG